MHSAQFVPGQPWLDAAGRHIQAHGANIIFHQGVWYWYGEDKSANLGGAGHNYVGVSAYVSTDLWHWRHLGVVLPKEALPPENREQGACERPKVLFNDRTGKFIMWMHLEEATSYHAAAAGVAIADNPAGPFVFLRKGRPIHFDFGYPSNDWTNQRQCGGTVRDMNLFLDNDGQAYVIYASEDNATLYIVQLNDELTWAREPIVKGVTWDRVAVGESREAPAPFKHGGRYYLFSSGTTGWMPNPGRVHVAEHILGPWRSLGDPCAGRDAHTNYRSQPTCVIPAPNAPEGCFIYCADRWNWHCLRDSSYVWLPFIIDAANPERIRLDFYDHWDLSIFDRKPAPPAASCPTASVDAEGCIRLHWPAVKGADGYYVYESQKYLGHTIAAEWLTNPYLPGQHLRFTVIAQTLTGGNAAPSPAGALLVPRRQIIRLSDLDAVRSSQGWGQLERNRGVSSGELMIAGKTYVHGLGTHAQSNICYALGAGYERLTGLAGVADSAWPNVRMRFRILADGRELFASPLLEKNDAAVPFDVPLKGVHELLLEAVATGDSHHGGHFSWVDTKLYCAN